MTDEPERIDRRSKAYRDAQAAQPEAPKEDKVTYSPALDHDDDGVNGGSKAKWFPVLLKKNYRPAGPYQVIDAEGVAQTPNVPAELAEGFGNRIVAGWTINLHKDEAIKVIKAGIADRADPLE